MNVFADRVGVDVYRASADDMEVAPARRRPAAAKTFTGSRPAVSLAHGDFAIIGPSAEKLAKLGRRLPQRATPNDDVVDTLITLINNRVFQGDAVNARRVPMSSNSFPFFAQPHMPVPAGRRAART